MHRRTCIDQAHLAQKSFITKYDAHSVFYLKINSIACNRSLSREVC